MSNLSIVIIEIKNTHDLKNWVNCLKSIDYGKIGQTVWRGLLQLTPLNFEFDQFAPQNLLNSFNQTLGRNLVIASRLFASKP